VPAIVNGNNEEK